MHLERTYVLFWIMLRAHDKFCISPQTALRHFKFAVFYTLFEITLRVYIAGCFTAIEELDSNFHHILTVNRKELSLLWVFTMYM